MNDTNVNSATVNKIVESAIELFNINGYNGTSISDISKKAMLSKGILYHYFKNKDDLYLHCAKKCIDEYSKYLEENLQSPISKPDGITENIKVRLQFFEEYPKYKALHNYIVSKKPNHLAKELVDIRAQLRINNIKQLKTLTNGMHLGKGVLDSDIVAFVGILQSSFSFLLQDNFDEQKKQEQIDTVVRLTKIFINGLTKDTE